MSSTNALQSESKILTAALRAIRRRKGLRVKDAAAAMGLPLRTYQHFESGRSQLDFDRIKAFARVTDSDPYAILAAVLIGSPAFAVRCMDNKLASVLVVAVKRFDERVGDAIPHIEVGRLIAAFRKMFDDLETDLQDRDDQARAWLEGDEP
ncbi:helix-turn-helix domain-containing protein [Phenylobacterium sp.]|uniref:helix-turn-helix domain-containing protein n=1 Tax=Phenylobacterium sp. TaxID=1871053 RepID=UPI0035B393BB